MILVVDDDKTIRLSLKLILERNEYEVALAEGPKEAVQIVRNTPAVELVLMDMNYSMSTDGEEGLTLLKQVKVFRPDVPCILMTAWGTIDLAVQGMRAGAFDFITKPWDNGVLLERIETARSLTPDSLTPDPFPKERGVYSSSAENLTAKGNHSPLLGRGAGGEAVGGGSFLEPTDTRIFAISEALKIGYSVEQIHQLTMIDRWFLQKLKHIVDIDQHLKENALLSEVSEYMEPSEFMEYLRSPEIFPLLRAAKVYGFSDFQIGRAIGLENRMKMEQAGLTVRKWRKELGLVPTVNQIDTLAAEYPAQTNYLYLSYL